jgi:hypothetical protein
MNISDNSVAHAATLLSVPPAETRRWRLLVFGGYLLAAIVMTWPLALHWRSGVIQKGTVPIDTGQGIWNLWWVRESLLDGRDPYLTRMLFYPLEVDLFWQTLSLPNALLSLPALLSLGPIAAFNLVTLLSFGLGGYFAYRLAHGVLKHRLGALAAGFVYAFSAYHMQLVLGGPMEVIAIQWIPLYLTLLMAALRQPAPRTILLAALALTVTTLASQYYGLYSAVYTVAHVGLALLLTKDWSRRRGIFLAALAIAGLWVGALLPLVWPLTTIGAAPPEDWYERQLFHSAELIDFLFPSTLHPWWGAWSQQSLGAIHPYGTEIGATFGIAIYGLMIYGVIKGRGRAWPWLLLALVALIFALGPELQFGARSTGVPLLFRALDLLGPFRNSSRPSYFIAILMLPVGVLVGFGFRALAALPRRGRYLLSGALAALLVLESWVARWPILPIRSDAAYASLHADPLPGAVLELPPQNDKSQYMLNQLCHGRPLMGGYVARTPYYPLITSALRRLWQALPPSPDIVAHNPAQELATLGTRFVVLNTEDLSYAQLDRLRQLLATEGISRYAVHEKVEIYQVDPQAARPALVLNRDWHEVESDGTRVWRWVGDQATIQILARSRAIVSLAFPATGYQAERPLRILLNGELLAEYQIPAAPYDRLVRFSLLLPAGEHELSFQSQSSPTPDGRRFSVSIEQMDVEARYLPDSKDHAPQFAAPPTLPMLDAPPCRP